MSPKELQYVEDALNHEAFLREQCKNASQQLQDSELKQYAQQLEKKHCQIFQSLFELV